jgi:hypothetical protein
MYNIDVLLYWLQRGLQVKGKSFSCENYLLLVFFILLFSSCHHGSWADPWRIQKAHAPILSSQEKIFHYLKVTNFEYSLKLLRSSGINSAGLCSLADRYDNRIPTRFLAPIDCLKIPAQKNKIPARIRHGADN